MLWHLFYDAHKIAIFVHLNKSLIMREAGIRQTVIHFDDFDLVIDEIVINLIDLPNVLKFHLHSLHVLQVALAMVHQLVAIVQVPVVLLEIQIVVL